MDEHIATITQCMDQVLAGREISREEAETLFAAGKEEPFFLMAAADKIRKTFCGDQMRFCSDVNARSGRCTENCKFCAQSGWYHTGVKEYPLRSPEDLLREAKQAEAYGAERFGIVTSGRGQSDPVQFASIVEADQQRNEALRLLLARTSDRRAAEDAEGGRLPAHPLQSGNGEAPFPRRLHHTHV